MDDISAIEKRLRDKEAEVENAAAKLKEMPAEEKRKIEDVF